MKQVGGSSVALAPGHPKIPLKRNPPANPTAPTSSDLPRQQTASGASVSAVHSASNPLVVQPVRAVGRTIRNIFVAAVIILALLLAIITMLAHTSTVPLSEESAVSVPLSDKSGCVGRLWVTGWPRLSLGQW
jgi:hypothetical protein